MPISSSVVRLSFFFFFLIDSVVFGVLGHSPNEAFFDDRSKNALLVEIIQVLLDTLSIRVVNPPFAEQSVSIAQVKISLTP